MAHGAQVRQGRAHADAAQVVGGRHADAGGVRAVGVLHRAVAFGQAGVVEGFLDVRPRTRLTPAYRHGAVRAVVVVLDVQIALHLPVEGQDLCVGPLVVATGGPVVKVLGKAPLHRLAVDGRAAPNDLALGNVDFALLRGDGSPQRPVMYRVLGFRVPGAAELDVVGQDCRVGVVVAGLQQEHRGVDVFGQPGRQRRTGRAAADHNNVVFHGSSTGRFAPDLTDFCRSL